MPLWHVVVLIQCHFDIILTVLEGKRSNHNPYRQHQANRLIV